jgi:tetratricopeptide (TPR) repeat protein
MPLRTGGTGVARDARSPGWVAALAAAFAVLVLLALAPSARAQIIDQLDVTTKGREADVEIRFTTTVQYLRHSPPAKGRLVKIEFRVTGPVDSQIGGRLVSEARTFPGKDAVPAFEVRYVAAQNALTVEFQREVEFRVSGAGDGRTILIRLALPSAPAAPARAPSRAGPPAAPTKPAAAPDAKPPPPSLAAAPDVERDGAAIVAEARKALAEGRAEEAIERLNRALNLPPGAFSPEAQELIGQAREKNGEVAKARAEYELYLKLYPDTPGAARVRERLEKLGKAPPPGRAERAAKPPSTTVYGSVSTTYYRGATKYDATLAPPIPGLQPDQVSLTSTDQSAFVTSIDLTGRYQDGPWDNKLVLRDTATTSLIRGDRNENRLAAAYYELNQKERDASVRLGRQSSPGAGVLGRFDGGWARLGITPMIKVNAVGGRTVEYYAAPRRDLLGASVDVGPWDNRLTTSLYVIGQRLDGLVDRQAVGTEMRYFDPTRNAFLLFDYDTKFRQVGTAMLQANWLTAAGTNYAFLYDRRRTPPLQVSNVSNAYFGARPADLRDTGLSYGELLAQARDITPVSDLVSIGLTHPLSPRWQLGADVKLSRVSGTRAVGQYPEGPASGNLWVYTVQGIGTGLLAANDVFVASLALNRAASFDGTSASASYVRVIERWRLEAGLKYYEQKDTNDLQLRRWTPNAKVGYRWGEHLTFEGEAGAEFTTLRGPTQSEDTRRHYFNLGVRWDFF